MLRHDFDNVYKPIVDGRIHNEIPREVCQTRDSPQYRMTASSHEIPTQVGDHILDGISVSGIAGKEDCNLYFCAKHPNRPANTLGLGTVSIHEAERDLAIPIALIQPFKVVVSINSKNLWLSSENDPMLVFHFLSYPPNVCIPRKKDDILFRCCRSQYWLFQHKDSLFRILDAEFDPWQSPWKYINPLSLSLDYC